MVQTLISLVHLKTCMSFSFWNRTKAIQMKNASGLHRYCPIKTHTDLNRSTVVSSPDPCCSWSYPWSQIRRAPKRNDEWVSGNDEESLDVGKQLAFRRYVSICSYRNTHVLNLGLPCQRYTKQFRTNAIHWSAFVALEDSLRRNFRLV